MVFTFSPRVVCRATEINYLRNMVKLSGFFPARDLSEHAPVSEM